MKLKKIIDKLMQNDQNATWYECQNIDELKDCIAEAMKGYEKNEDTYKFYESVLNLI